MSMEILIVLFQYRYITIKTLKDEGSNISLFVFAVSCNYIAKMLWCVILLAIVSNIISARFYGWWWVSLWVNVTTDCKYSVNPFASMRICLACDFQATALLHVIIDNNNVEITLDKAHLLTWLPIFCQLCCLQIGSHVRKWWLVNNCYDEKPC